MKLRIAGLAKSKRGREKKDFITEVGRFSKSYVRGLLEEIKDLEDKSVEQPTPGNKRKLVESSKRLFVMGFTIVAKNIMDGGSSFSPNDVLIARLPDAVMSLLHLPSTPPQPQTPSSNCKV